MTLVRMGDGIAYYVLVPYRTFERRWGRALLGNWRRRALIRFHRWFGVYLRAHPRLMPVVYRDADGRLRRCILNPTQICYIEEP